MYQSFKERFLYVLEVCGCSKSKAAEKLNVSPAYVSQLCSGVREPSDRTISDICRIFGCDEIWLRTGEGDPFCEESREEQIMRFAMQTIKGSSEFVKAFAAMLSKLDVEDWEALEKIFKKLADEQKK